MSKINFTPVDGQITKLPEEASMVDSSDVGFSTYVKGDKLKSGDPVDATLLDIDVFTSGKGAAVIRLLLGIIGGKSYDGTDVTGRSIVGDKNLSENAAQYSVGDLAALGLVDNNIQSITEEELIRQVADKIFDPAEKAKLLQSKIVRVSVEESEFKGKTQRKVSSITQPIAKLSKADFMAKMKGLLLPAIAKSKAGNKPAEKLPTSTPPANQRPAAGDPFAVSAPGFVADPGAGDLGSL